MLTEGVDFKCVDRSGRPLPICYGVGIANHRLFQRLQTLLNRFAFAVPHEAGKVELGGRMTLHGAGSSIAVDGLIGVHTEILTAGAAEAAQLLGFPSDLIDRAARLVGAAVGSKEFVAANAPELIAALTEPARAFENLRREQGRRQASTIASTPSPTRTARVATGAAPSPSANDRGHYMCIGADRPTQAPPWWKIAIGAIVVLGAGYLVTRPMVKTMERTLG